MENGLGEKRLSETKSCFQSSLLAIILCFFFWLKFQGSNGAGVAAKKIQTKKL